MTGTSFNQYRITASIGAGGMGEVFRARDTRPNRDVAIKVLPKDFVSDPLENIFVTKDARVKILDFGLAIRTSREAVA